MSEPARIVQNCYVVRNLEEACARMHALYGIGPFIGGVEAELSDHEYRGRPAPPIRLRGVFVQSGDLNIELVELVSTSPSAFHDMFAAGAEGFHHVAMFCADYAAERDAMIAQGYALASEFSVTFGPGDVAQICYLDARDTLGHMIELYPEHPVIRDMYRQARVAPDGWDGQRLIIPWGEV
ncbi:VOC family protein [Sphingomonas profundi]|uniref:VOC family protein n=1 Tax=Alterirhizorhabdus profundi TaxID=2681549 RepID=UPI0018D047CD|nr:VOC family protein [Sphingomonas profundi]